MGKREASPSIGYGKAQMQRRQSSARSIVSLVDHVAQMLDSDWS